MYQIDYILPKETVSVMITELIYNVFSNGVIGIDLNTMPSIPKDFYYQHPTIVADIPDIAVGDVFDLTNIDGRINWSRTFLSPNVRYPVKKLSQCPRCNMPIVDDELHQVMYCLNDNCPHKLLGSIHRMLSFLNTWKLNDIECIHLALNNGLTYTSDLFKLDKFLVGSNVKKLMTKLEYIKGYLSLGQFLFAMNIPGDLKLRREYIDIQIFDNEIKTIHDLYAALPDMLLNPDKYSHYLSPAFILILETYLNLPMNKVNLLELHSLGYFRYIQ